MNDGGEVSEVKANNEFFSKVVGSILTLFFSITLSILVIEIFLSKSNYPFQDCTTVSISAETYLGRFDELTGWSYKPKISYSQGAGGFTYHFNDEGIRVASPDAQIDYGKPRIIFVGDSVTFGEELDYEDSFVSQIDKLLDDKFEVINLGVQGYGTDQSMLRLEKYIEELDPTFVVYTFIVDHKNRNINYDRRLHVKCFEFAGTKSLFGVDGGQLRQVAFPKKPIETDRFKTGLFLSHSWQNFREQLQKKQGEDTLLTKSLVNKIGEIIVDHGAKDYYIYFDTIFDTEENSYHERVSKSIFSEDQLSRTLMFVNWAADSGKQGTKYFVNETDDLHPNASLSAQMAKNFIEKFGKSFVVETH